jgi:hypothetical protein
LVRLALAMAVASATALLLAAVASGSKSSKQSFFLAIPTLLLVRRRHQRCR